MAVYAYLVLAPLGVLVWILWSEVRQEAAALKKIRELEKRLKMGRG